MAGTHGSSGARDVTEEDVGLTAHAAGFAGGDGEDGAMRCEESVERAAQRGFGKFFRQILDVEDRVIRIGRSACWKGVGGHCENLVGRQMMGCLVIQLQVALVWV